MQTSHFWNSVHLLRTKIALAALCLLAGEAGMAQSKIPNMINHDDKAYYLGLSFTFNNSSYRILKSDYFAENDSVMLLDPIRKPGLGLGILGCLKLTNRFDLQFVPMIQLTDRSIVFVDNKYGLEPNEEETYRTESILFHLPLSLKLKSDRMRNFRFYGLAGLKLDWDMSSNARSQKTIEIIKVKPIDFGYEIGAGLEFYFSNFILSPEIKLSRGLADINILEDNSQISKSIEELRTYIWMVTFNIKG